MNDKNEKIFQALIAHDELANRQLSELREKIEVQVEGKIAGIQTEMHQRFEEVNNRFDQILLLLRAGLSQIRKYNNFRIKTAEDDIVSSLIALQQAKRFAD